jgi:hypothetical protein
MELGTSTCRIYRICRIFIKYLILTVHFKKLGFTPLSHGARRGDFADLAVRRAIQSTALAVLLHPEGPIFDQFTRENMRTLVKYPIYSYLFSLIHHQNGI